MIDEFLVPNAQVIRLLNEHKKHGTLTIGFDFDGTVHDYHKTGATYHNVIALLRKMKELGFTLICWTAHRDHKYVEKFLLINDIPFDGINTDGVPLEWETRKPFFNALLDDRSGLEQVYQELTLLVYLIKQK